MRPARRRIVVATTAIAVLVAGYGAGHDYFEAAAFVVRAAGMKGAARSFANLEAVSVTESEIAIPSNRERARTTSSIETVMSLSSTAGKDFAASDQRADRLGGSAPRRSNET